MAPFRYEAFAPSGKILRGEVEAPHLAGALAILQAQGIRPYRTDPVIAGKAKTFELTLTRSPLGLAWRARLFRQLGTLLSAGVPLDRGLHILASGFTAEREHKIAESLLARVTGGKSLSAAMRQEEGVFPADECGLIQAGEQSGSLIPVLGDLATVLERRLDIRSKVVSALVYPAFLMALAPICLIIIATVLVPNIAPLFEGTDAPMPFALRLMVWGTRSFDAHKPAWIAILLVILGSGLLAVRNPRIQHGMKRLPARLPFTKPLAHHATAGRVCRTLGALLRGGLPLQAALATTVEVTSDPILKTKLATIRAAVTEGQKLSKALARLPELPPPMLQMIAIGEDTNTLDVMLLYVADAEEKALASAIDRLMTLLTPLLTILMGLMVGGIVMSIMRAILSINDLALK